MFSRSRLQTRFAILPPSRTAALNAFRSPQTDNRSYHDLMARMQRLRGRVYGADGAIRRSDLTSDGRHKLSVDERSWHVLSLDSSGEVTACLRFLEETGESGLDRLQVRHAAVLDCPVQGPRFRRAVELEMKRARRGSVRFGEVGGWAVAEGRRCTTESLNIVLATYGLLELLGSCTGVATATFRHQSALILQRIGLAAIQLDGAEIPPYHDPQYGCLMQVLMFDSRRPNPKYREWIAELMAELAISPVVCREDMGTTIGRVWRGMDAPDFARQPEALAVGA